LYIPEGETKHAAKSVGVAANIAKPVTGVLMIMAMPAAISLEKVL
jgi:hypothetical protein